MEVRPQHPLAARDPGRVAARAGRSEALPDLPRRPRRLPGRGLRRTSRLSCLAARGRGSGRDAPTGSSRPSTRSAASCVTTALCVGFYGWTATAEFMDAWKRTGLKPVGHMVWHKNYASRVGFVAARHEQAFLLAKGNPPRPENPLPDWGRPLVSHARATGEQITVPRPIDTLMNNAKDSSWSAQAILVAIHRFCQCCPARWRNRGVGNLAFKFGQACSS